MKCWVIDRKVDLKTESAPMKLINLPAPEPRSGELLLKVKACGV
jgi:D-arabinose 1-dehydrogenase-like Zn-dependent alcohol dehydrogenase